MPALKAAQTQLRRPGAVDSGIEGSCALGGSPFAKSQTANSTHSFSVWGETDRDDADILSRGETIGGNDGPLEIGKQRKQRNSQVRFSLRQLYYGNQPSGLASKIATG